MNWKQILIGKWSWKRPLYSLGSIYIFLAITTCSLGDKLIFMPPPSSYNADLEGLETIGTDADNQIAIVHLKALPGAPTLLYSHGNAEDIGQNIDIFREWHARGLGVIAYDYPGYGLSPGSSSEKKTEQAINSVWEYALASGIKPSSMIIVGRSIGTGPSVWLASSVKPAGLILISPLKSAYTVAIPTPFPIFPGDRFPNIDRIKKIYTPLLVIHGKDDNVIPFSHGIAIFENSPATEKTFLQITNAGHNDLFFVGGEEIISVTSDFAKKFGK
jgi:pimeloyl-ACP methyl ester carboxylesterase